MDRNGKRLFLRRRSFYLALSISIVWTLVLGGLFLHLQNTNNDSARKMAMNAARAYFNKDYSLRLWAASHGGIYVPVSEKTPPNPLLAHVKDRDVITPSGTRLTLMNPDYFLRNYREEFTIKYGVKGNLTSLKPLQTKNKPDEWQRCSLVKFEEGVTEEVSYVDINGEPHLRLMQPLMTEEGCLKCHGHQGFKIGDVRGGVSVSVPMNLYLKEAEKTNFSALMIFAGVWFAGILGVVISSSTISRYFWQKEAAYDELLTNNRILDGKIKVINSLNKDLEAFDYTLSNALKVPIRHIEGFSKVLLENMQGNEFQNQKNYTEIIAKSSEDLRALVDSILILSRANRQEVVREEVDLTFLTICLMDKIKTERKLGNMELIIAEGLTCCCDSSLVKILLYNLLDNAAKYSSLRGEEQTIEFGETILDGSRVFFIKDNGIGIDMNRAEKLFIPFHSYHEDKDFEGLGLGLATSNRIAERHGGKIWVESESGKGATFYFTLG